MENIAEILNVFFWITEYPLTKNNLESLYKILTNMLAAGFWEKRGSRSHNERTRIISIVKNLEKYINSKIKDTKESTK